VNNNPTEDVTVRILRNDLQKETEKKYRVILLDARHEAEPYLVNRQININFDSFFIRQKCNIRIYMKREYGIYKGKKLTKSDISEIIPERLYKYRAINDNTYKLIQTNSLWFSKPKDFNDPFDCKLSIKAGMDKDGLINNLSRNNMLEGVKREYKDEFEKMINNPASFNKVMDNIHQIYINSHVGVCCLAEAPDNILMWSHYADSHQGICLEFGIERDGFYYHNLLPVQYRNKYPLFDLSNYSTEKRGFYTMHQQAICTKSSLWEYEHEWRVISDEGAGAYPFEKRHLTKIIFGVNTSEDEIDKIIKMTCSSGYAKALFYRCELFTKTYGLKIKRIYPIEKYR
jgi:hypothetical protein